MFRCIIFLQYYSRAGKSVPCPIHGTILILFNKTTWQQGICKKMPKHY